MATDSCFNCNGELDDEFRRRVQYGYWNDAAENWQTVTDGDRSLTENWVCNDCWTKEYRAIKGAYFDVEDPQVLWDILNASDGRLVADSLPIQLGARTFFRIVDGDVRAVNSKFVQASDKSIRMTPNRLDVTREDFFDLLTTADAHRTPSVILRPVEETLFGDIRERGTNSHKLDEFQSLAGD